MHDTKQHTGSVQNKNDEQESFCVTCGGQVVPLVCETPLWHCSRCKMVYSEPPPAFYDLFPNRRQLLEKMAEIARAIC